MLENLQKCFPKRAERMRPGRLETQVEFLADAVEAYRMLVRFGGEGWLCTAADSGIVRFGPDRPLPDAQTPAPWIVSAEAANGSRSLHVQRTPAGWQLATIVPDGNEPGGILVESVLTARDGKGDLRYETSWHCQNVAGLEEFRPAAFRFLGFESKKGN